MPKKKPGQMHDSPTSRNVSGMMGKGVTKGMSSNDGYKSAKGSSGKVVGGRSGKKMKAY